MKYEADIIKEIVDDRGHIKSSLHYQSECVEEWVKEVEGAYPKLCDYQSEWVNYINENPIGNFPYVTLTDVTNATVENVVPYAYKSAILKGQTLVNLVTQKSGSFNGTRFLRIPLIYVPKTNTKYFVKFNVRESSLTDGVTCRLKNTTSGSVVGGLHSDGIITVTVEGCDYIEFFIANADDVTNGLDAIVDDIMLIEYQERLENEVILYFEGMQSVKLPVLTTSIEDGTKTNILTVNEDVTLRGIGDVQDTLDCLTGEVTQRIGEIVLDGSENWSKYNIYPQEGYTAFITTIETLNNLYHNTDINFISADFSTGTWYDYRSNLISEFVWNHDPNKIGIRVKNEIATDVNGIKTFLSTNNIRINYKLATESIKTVTLSVIDQDGKTLEKIKPIEGTMHINTSGDPIKPLFSGEIPVEAITQNLASFIEE